MIMVGQHWNETGENGWIREDINRDGTVNVLDAHWLARIGRDRSNTMRLSISLAHSRWLAVLW